MPAHFLPWPASRALSSSSTPLRPFLANLKFKTSRQNLKSQEKSKRKYEKRLLHRMHSKLCTHFTHCISLLLCLPAFVFRTASQFFLDYFVHFRQLAHFSGVMLPAAACLRAAATRASLRPLSTSAVLQQQQTGQTGEKKPKRNSSNISLAVSNFGILKSSICSHAPLIWGVHPTFEMK